MSRTIKPAENQTEFAFDRRDRFRFLRGADFGDPEEYGRKNFAGLKRLIEIIETKTARDDATYLTQTELAEIWGVSRRTVNRWIQTGVSLGVIVTEERIERGGRRANRTSIDWEQVRRYATGGNQIDLGVSSIRPSAAAHKSYQNCDTVKPGKPLRHDGTALRHAGTALCHDGATYKEQVRFTGPVEQSPPQPPEGNRFAAAAGIIGFEKQAVKPSRFARTAFDGVATELIELGVRNVSRAINAARRRGMTPADVAGVIVEVRARAGDFDDPGAAVYARLVDLDQLPPPSPAARRRQADAKRTAAAAAAVVEARRAAAARAERLRRAANRPTWEQLADDERRRRTDQIKTKFPTASPQMLKRFAAAAYLSERNRDE